MANPTHRGPSLSRVNGFGVEVVAAASADSIFDLDLPGPGGIQTRRCCVVLHVFFSSPSSWVPSLPSFLLAGHCVADYFFHRRDWRCPFPVLSGVHPLPIVSSAFCRLSAAYASRLFCCRDRSSPKSCSALLPTWLSTSFTDEWAVLGEGPLSVLRGPPQPPPGGLT